MIRPGLLRHKVRIERQAATKDAHGQPVDSWALIAERRAEIVPLSGKEYAAAMAENNKETTRIRLRFESVLADLVSGDRVVHGSNVYDIKSIINPRIGNRELILMCELSA